MSLGTRIEERLQALGMSQAELARRVGVQSTSIWKLVTGQSVATKHLHKIARELGTTADYLLGETEDPGGGAVGLRSSRLAEAEPRTDLIEIDSIDLTFGLGGSFLDTPAEVEKATFSLHWLRQFTRAPAEMLFSTQGIGDSMMPSIHDRDVLIIDRSQTMLQGNVGDKFWAVIYGGVGMIKRLRPLPDGTVRIMSDNQLIRDEIATDSDLFVVGRVVAVVKSV